PGTPTPSHAPELGPRGTPGRLPPEDAVTAFLTDSFTLVPAGSETDHLDIDATLARLRAAG
ncbi:hypothetical protein, partial [Kitasatospora sp. NPDC001225]